MGNVIGIAGIANSMKNGQLAGDEYTEASLSSQLTFFYSAIECQTNVFCAIESLLISGLLCLGFPIVIQTRIYCRYSGVLLIYIVCLSKNVQIYVHDYRYSHQLTKAGKKKYIWIFSLHAKL